MEDKAELMANLPLLPEHNLTEEQTEFLSDELSNLGAAFFNKIATLSNAQLGSLVREYVMESEHNSWEGFSYSDLFGIYRMFADMERFAEHANLDDQAAWFGVNHQIDAQGLPIKQS